MKYVLDASVALKTVLVEPDSDKARTLVGEYVSGVHELIAPDTFPVEIAHALTKAGRRGIIPVADVIAKIRDVLQVSPALHPYIPLLPRAVDIANQARIGIYDCLFVALAEQENCDLITADARLVTNLQTEFPFIRKLSSL